MTRKILTAVMALVLLIVTVGCTPAAKDIYSNYYEYMYIDPATGEFVDPDTYLPNVESETESSEDDYSSEDNHSSEDDSSSSEETEKKPVIINVADYGAKGDGKNDDAVAISAAVEALMQGGKGSKLVFGKNKTYYMKNNNGKTRALTLIGLENATVEGNGSTILCDGELTYMQISDCKNLTVKALNFDRKIRAHFVGTVYDIDYQNGYVDVVSDRDIGFSEEEYVPMTGDHFGFVNTKPGETPRSYFYMEKFGTIDAKARKYRYYVDMQGALGTVDNLGRLKVGDEIIVPTPYVGHYLQDSFFIGGCSDLLMKDINVYSIPRFGFHINGNPGKLTFDNVDMVPAPDEKVVFVSWRDGFHCKYNYDSITWKNCDARGNGDDIINISANMLYVNKKYSDNEIGCVFPQTMGSYGKVNVGDIAVIYDVDTGRLLKKTTVKRVVSEYENRYILSEPVPGLKTGENIRVYFDNHAAPNSQLINCNFEGTLRFRGAGGTATNCKLKMYAMMMYPETNVEGPIPHDLTFKNCDFTGSWEGRIDLSCLSPVSLWKEGYYRLENIKFENCKGLTKSLFSNELNFNSKSVDYITITPALAD